MTRFWEETPKTSMNCLNSFENLSGYAKIHIDIILIPCYKK